MATDNVPDVTPAEELDAQLLELMKTLSSLSNRAKALGRKTTMYALNRAWHEVYNARESGD